MATDGTQSETVGEVAYRRIRTDIIFGRLQPGERLRLDRISSAYTTSVSTLRELLNRLASEGLIVAEGQRGFQVAPISAGDFRQVAAMRLLLECHAIDESFRDGDLDWEGRVVSAHHKLAVMERRMVVGDQSEPELWKRCDWEFHHALISACGSKVLLDYHSAIYDRYLRYQMIAVIFRGEIAAREHQELLDCALRRDHAHAKKVLAAHINGCVEHALEHDPAGLFFDTTRQAAVKTTRSAARSLRRGRPLAHEEDGAPRARARKTSQR